MSLNEKQKAFCEYYAACFNATEAAKKAGYSEKTAYSIGNENLKKPEIQNYLQTLTEAAKSSRIATIDEVLTYLSDTMRNTEEQTKERTKAAQILRDALAGTSHAQERIGITLEIKDLTGDDGNANHCDDT